MREVPGSNPIRDIAFFSGKTCSTVTALNERSAVADDTSIVIRLVREVQTFVCKGERVARR